MPSSDARFFVPGCRLKLQVTIQGTFKQRLRFDRVVNGQEFRHPFVRVPARRIVELAWGIVRRQLPPTLSLGALQHDEVHVLKWPYAQPRGCTARATARAADRCAARCAVAVVGGSL